jgi:hypothetical protein
MSSRNLLGETILLLLGYVDRSRVAEEESLLRRAVDAVVFLSKTGQLYPFEEFHQGRTPGQAQSVADADVTRLLEQLCAQAPSAEDKELLQVAISALAYIESTGQLAARDEYVSYVRHGTLPPVLAAFKSEAEAEAWLAAQRVVPKSAHVLIAGEYHFVFASRESLEMPFVKLPLVAEFLERKLEAGAPPPTAAFDTREEAEAWLATQVEPPRHAFITIGGEPYMAAWWERVGHRALYPFTLVEDLRRERREREELSALLEKERLQYEERVRQGAVKESKESEEGPEPE